MMAPLSLNEVSIQEGDEITVVKKKILHLFPNEKFTADYIERINKLFDASEHTFVVSGKPHSSIIKESDAENVIYAGNSLSTLRGNWELISRLYRSDLVVIHSLFFPGAALCSIAMSAAGIGKKMIWMIWGGDLYGAVRNKPHGIKGRIIEFARKRIISCIAAVGAIPQDYELMKANYHSAAKLYQATYTYDFLDIPAAVSGGAVKILIGNSGNPTCRHFDAIDMLSGYTDKEIEVRCVLSYSAPSEEYVEKVVNYGKAALGDKFIPLIDFMPYEEYMQMLADTDIVILNNDRQQGFGNTASLLYYGKRVFMSPDNPVGDYFRSLGAVVFSTEDLSDDEICKKDCSELRGHNKRIIQDHFSDEEFYSRWDKIFSEVGTTS